MRADIARGDAGVGVVSSLAALVTFVALLLFATHVLLTLHARTVATSAAHEAARTAAIDPGDPMARRRGEARARELLGAMGASASFDWSRSNDDVAVVRLQAEAPRFVVTIGASAGISTHIDRTASVRVERPR